MIASCDPDVDELGVQMDWGYLLVVLCLVAFVIAIAITAWRSFQDHRRKRQ